MRRNGRSLAEIARSEIGPVAGGTAMLAILFIVVIALAGLGIDPDRVIEVYNKADRLPQPDVEPYRESSRRNAVLVSALTGRGIDRLAERIRDRELAEGEVLHLVIPHDQSRLAAQLHDVAAVYEQRATDEGTLFTAWIPPSAIHQFAPYITIGTGNAARAS